LENRHRIPPPSPKFGEKRPSSPALVVARGFLAVSKTDSLRLYGSVGEDDTSNGPP
jgi:hypothetical protein